MSECLDEEVLLQSVSAPEHVTAPVRAHLLECASCRALLSELAQGEQDEQLPLRRGDVVDRYRIDSVLGAGGMGQVYRAFDLELERPVALKILNPTGKSLEAAALARTAHPSVVTVYDVGVQRGLSFIAMELVDGSTLSEWQETSSEAERAAAAFAIIAGVVALHEAGVVHGDLKPSNVLIDRARGPRLIDFGLSRVGSRGQAGMTPAFAAPEVACGFPASVLSDQYSLAVLLLSLLPRRTREVSSVLQRASNANASLRFPTVRSFQSALLAAWNRRVRRARFLMLLAVSFVFGVALSAALPVRTEALRVKHEIAALYPQSQIWRVLEKTFVRPALVGPCVVTQERLRDAAVSYLLGAHPSQDEAEALVGLLLPPSICRAGDDADPAMSATIAAAQILLHAKQTGAANALLLDETGDDARIVRSGVLEYQKLPAAVAQELSASPTTVRGRIKRLGYALRVGAPGAATDAEALLAWIDTHAPDGALAAKALAPIARAFASAARYAEAEQLGRRAVALVSSTLGDDHPAMSDAWNGLSFTAIMQGEPGRFSEASRRALEIAQRFYSPGHAKLTRLLTFLAQERTYLGYFDESLALLEQAGLTRNIGERDQFNLDAMQLQPLVELGRIAEARAAYNRASALANKDDQLGLDVTWSEVLFAQGQRAQALGMLRPHIDALPGHSSDGDSLLALLLALERSPKTARWLTRIGPARSPLGAARIAATKALLSRAAADGDVARLAYRRAHDIFTGERNWAERNLPTRARNNAL